MNESSTLNKENKTASESSGRKSVRRIRKTAVLGSGVMGSRIACHLANAGLEVLLLDMVPKEAKAVSPENNTTRNAIVDQALKTAIRSSPSPLYHKKGARLITTGNFEDHLAEIKDCDWVIEAIIENLEIKQSLFEKVEEYRKPGSLITTNTSGIPITWLAKDRSEDFKKHFFGTHFFNPPRYLQLLEIIPHEETTSDVIDFFMDYGDRFLGKKTVLCKDTPAFIANRIGVFSIAAIFQAMEKFGLEIEEIDAITGPLIGRPKSATFRTCDVVGIDTLVKVAENTYEACPQDESREILRIPDFIKKMVEKGQLGDKSKKGFYKKTRDADGKRVIQTIDPGTLDYQDKKRPKLEVVGRLKPEEDVRKRIRGLFYDKSKFGEFFRYMHCQIFQYASHRIPEIADTIYQIDDAIKAGFGWGFGVFETWETLGLEKVADVMKSLDIEPSGWVKKMLAAGEDSFYKVENGKRYFYDPEEARFKLIPGTDQTILLANFKDQKPVFQNAGATLYDIGDDVLCLEFHTKMNTLGGEVLQAINKSIELAEENYRGLVIGNEADNFSAGANLGMVFMLAVEQEFEELNFAIQLFQKTAMRLRYSAIPVVVCPHGLTLGGGCELTMHSDAAIAAAETYIGLVEVGVGVIPGGGGTKEMVLRVSDSYIKDDPEIPLLQQMFVNIATARVATSAQEGFDIRVLDRSKDQMEINGSRVIDRARQKVLELSNRGYTQPVPRTDIKVLGKTALGTLYAGTDAFKLGKYATEHDAKVARKLAYVMCGGDLSAASEVDEQYLLDLEREAFLSLLGERKTLERIQAVIKTGRPVRN